MSFIPAIVFSLNLGWAETSPELRTPVFTRDIAPILWRHCAECHRPGEFAPFSVLTYHDVAQHARAIARAVATGSMPPWKPVEGFGRFAGARRLTKAEIDRIAAWAKAGAPEGDSKLLTAKPPEFSETWRTGKPDTVAEMAAPYTVQAHGDDEYRCFAVPLGLAKDVFVRAVEYKPSNPRVVHHALLFADNSGAARETAARNGGSYSCFGTPGFLPSAALGGWSPGARAFELPEGAAIRLRAGADLVLQLHLHPRGAEEHERSSVALFFTGRPPERSLMDVGLVSRTIDIPPGERAYVVRDHFELPVDVHAVGIIPHAHYLCRDMKGWAVLPGGEKRWLLWIRDWDFNWQEQYRYATPVPLPAGTRIEMEFTYDNSGANPHNPNVPPKRVTWGPGSTDEMAGLHVQVLCDRPADAPELGRALWGKIMRMVGGSFYRLPQ